MTAVTSELLENSYCKSIHLGMLRDKIRVNSYINAIKKNKIDFKNKIIADIGAGTGILSILAIKLGAKKVYAIEGQKSTIPTLEKMLNINNVSKNVIIINEISTNVNLPEKVDTIIHELIGIFVVNERGMECIIDARERFLKKGGKIYPNKFVLNFALISYLPTYVTAIKSLDYPYLNMYEFKKFSIDTYCIPYHNNIYSIQNNLVKYKYIESSNIIKHYIDLEKDSIESIQDFKIPLKFISYRFSNLITSWFDIIYDGTSKKSKYTTLDNITNWGIQYILYNEDFYLKNKKGIFNGSIHFKTNLPMNYTMNIKLYNNGKTVLKKKFNTMYNNFWADRLSYGTNKELVLS